MDLLFGEVKITCLPISMNITEIIKKFKSFMVLGDAASKLETFVWIFDFVSVQPKSIKLGQMANLNVIFHLIVSIY